MKLPPTHPAEDKALYQTTLTVRQCARDRDAHTHTNPTPRPWKERHWSGPNPGANPRPDLQREEAPKTTQTSYERAQLSHSQAHGER